jgi:hypothetical protein
MRHEPKLEPCQAIALAWQTRGSLDGLSHVFFIVMTCAHVFFIVMTCAHVFFIVMTCAHVFFIVMTCAHVFFIAMGVCIGSLLVLKKSRFNGKGSAL